MLDQRILGVETDAEKQMTGRSEACLSLDTVLVSEPQVGAGLIETGVQGAELSERDPDRFRDLVAEVTAGDGDVLLAGGSSLGVDRGS